MNAIRQYVVFSFITSLAISAIVVEYVPFLRETGFSLSEIALLSLGYNVLIAMVEVPTGIYADRHGCKSAVQWSQIIYVAGITLYGLTTSKAFVIMAVVLTAISFAMQSGARQSWLMSQMTAATTPKQRRRAFADSMLAAQCGAILAPMLSAALKAQWQVNVFFLSAILSLIALAVTLFWSPDQPIARPHQGWAELFHQGRLAALEYPLLRWLGWMSFVFALISVVTNQWSLALRESHWPMDGYWVWFAMQAGLMLGSVAYRQLPGHHAPFAMVVSLTIAGGCLVFAVRSPDYGWMALLALLQASRAFFQVARDHTVQSSVPMEVRATAASWISLASQIGMMAVLGFTSLVTIGRHTALEAMQVTWTPAGLALSTCSVLFYLRYRVKRYAWS